MIDADIQEDDFNSSQFLPDAARVEALEEQVEELRGVIQRLLPQQEGVHGHPL